MAGALAAGSMVASKTSGLFQRLDGMLTPRCRAGGPAHPARSLPLALPALVMLLVALLAACSSPKPPLAKDAAAAPVLAWGVYAGPGARGVRGARQFAVQTRTPITRVLDFLPDESWRALTHADWLIDAHERSAFALELSVPMLPRRGETTLAACARGDYNKHWRTIAQRLRRAHLQSTTIRPGWEFNGDWYRWSAADPVQAASYAGCFRQLVTTMRAVSATLRFSWSVNNGHNRLPAELGWPGDDYVDTVGVDAYDYSADWYPTPPQMTAHEARAKAWQTQLDGDHGLRYWVGFAAQHGASIGLSEWGLAWRSDGHAGGDNTYFLDQMGRFLRDPANRVAYATYFNSPDTPSLRHDLLGRDTAFPQAARRFAELAAR